MLHRQDPWPQVPDLDPGRGPALCPPFCWAQAPWSVQLLQRHDARCVHRPGQLLLQQALLHGLLLYLPLLPLLLLFQLQLQLHLHSYPGSAHPHQALPRPAWWGPSRQHPSFHLHLHWKVQQQLQPVELPSLPSYSRLGAPGRAVGWLLEQTLDL